MRLLRARLFTSMRLLRAYVRAMLRAYVRAMGVACSLFTSMRLLRAYVRAIWW